MANAYNNNELMDDASSNDIHNARCDGCQATKIYSDRYKCLECVDHDLCGECFEHRRQTKQHLNGHAMIHFKIPNELFDQPILNTRSITLKNIHQFLIDKKHDKNCNGCQKSIIGVRFKCDTCHNYNLCSNCTQQRITNQKHENTHSMVVASHQSFPKIDINDIRKGDVLGRGGFGEVCKAKWISKNRLVACKTILVNSRQIELEKSFRKELAAYSELSGAYILKSFGYGEHLLANGKKECYLITEFMDRGSLADVIHDQNEKISLRHKFSMACHIVSGMRKIHAHSMIHRDIRPDNILVSKNYIAKIGDMGIANIFKSNEKHTIIGCAVFMPPEFHRGDGHYDQSLDIFTFGLTLNELFTGKTHQFISSTKYVKLVEQSPIFADLIVRCIDKIPARRPTATELEEVLHKYRRAADKHIQEKHPNYKNQTLKAKDDIFVRFYNAYCNQEVLEPKRNYSPPPQPQFNPDLVRQHFDDMMKEFDDFQQLKFHHFKDHRCPSPFMQWSKFFDDDDRDFNIGFNMLNINRHIKF